jgi:hypothetical protein
MSDQEQEREKRASEDPDVEGHRAKGYGDEGSEDKELGKRETDEEPDVEGHRLK